MKIEIVTHCYRYATLLRHQLSSLVLGPPPPGVQVTATVCHTPEDEETTRALAWFGRQESPGVTWNWLPLPTAELCRRSIGRNRAALATQADWVWPLMTRRCGSIWQASDNGCLRETAN